MSFIEKVRRHSTKKRSSVKHKEHKEKTQLVEEKKSMAQNRVDHLFIEMKENILSAAESGKSYAAIVVGVGSCPNNTKFLTESYLKNTPYLVCNDQVEYDIYFNFLADLLVQKLKKSGFQAGKCNTHLASETELLTDDNNCFILKPNSSYFLVIATW